jgi:hypothetical protein
MRNDARPIGEDSPASPVGGTQEPAAAQASSDSRDSVTHDRQSHVVNRPAEEDDEDRTVRWQPRRSVRRSSDR